MKMKRYEKYGVEELYYRLLQLFNEERDTEEENEIIEEIEKVLYKKINVEGKIFIKEKQTAVLYYKPEFSFHLEDFLYYPGFYVEYKGMSTICTIENNCDYVTNIQNEIVARDFAIRGILEWLNRKN